MAERFWNVPNAVTLMRLPLLIPVLASADPHVRLVGFMLVAALDVADGYLARWLQQETRVGAWLDPLVDKAVALITFLVAFPSAGLGWGWAALFFIRDAGVLASFAVLRLLKRTLPDLRARWTGKTVTLAQFLVLLAMLAGMTAWLRPSLLALAALSLVALGDYALRLRGAVKDPVL